jgi:TolA-binding protein
VTAPDCPKPAALESAHDGRGAAEGHPERDAVVLDHLAGCAECTARLSELTELGTLARQFLPVDRTGDAELALAESRLLGALDGTLDDQPARPRWFSMPTWGLAAAAAAAVVIAFLAGVASAPLLRSSPSPVAAVTRPAPAVPPGPRLVLRPAPDAIYRLGGSQLEPQVRLLAGALDIEVDHMGQQRRLRVVTVDGEVEARSGRFQVSAQGERLAGVSVGEGEVEVHRQGRVERLREEQRLDVRLELTRRSAVFAGAGPEAPDAAVGTLADEPKRGPRRRSPGSRPATGSAPPPTTAEPALPDPPAPEPAPPSVSSPSTPFRSALALFSQKEYVRAAVEFGAEADRPSSPLREDARFWAAVAWARAGDRKRAATAFRTFLSEHPRSPRQAEAQVALGWQLVGTGDLAGARSHFLAGGNATDAAVRESVRLGLQVTATAR